MKFSRVPKSKTNRAYVSCFSTKPVKFGEVDAVPFTHSSHEEVEGSVHVIEGLYGLSHDEITFLSCAFNLDFGDFYTDVAVPNAEVFWVFDKASFDSDLLHACVKSLDLLRVCGFGYNPKFSLGLVCNVWVFKVEGVVSAGL